MAIPLKIELAVKVDGSSALDVFVCIISLLSAPGIAVAVILGFMFSWNAFSFPLMLARLKTFPVRAGAIRFISDQQVSQGQMAAAIVAVLPQLVLRLLMRE